MTQRGEARPIADDLYESLSVMLGQSGDLCGALGDVLKAQTAVGLGNDQGLHEGRLKNACQHASNAPFDAGIEMYNPTERCQLRHAYYGHGRLREREVACATRS